VTRFSELAKEIISPERVAGVCESLLRYPSPQSDLFEADPQIKAFIRDEVLPRASSVKYKNIEIDANGNLVSTYGPGNNGKQIMWIGYGMTAAPGTMEEPFAGRRIEHDRLSEENGGSLWGRGACEQKGALAAMLVALEVIGEVDIEGELIFLTSTAGETGRHDSVKGMIESRMLTADQALIGLGTDNLICLGNKGRIDLDIVIKGVSAHSSTPWLGRNAVDGVRYVLDLLDKVSMETVHPHLGKNTLTVTRIETFPKATHTVPAECRITLDRRLLPGESPQEATEEINALLKIMDGNSNFDIRLEPGPFMYPSEVAQESDLAQSWLRAHFEATGKDGCFGYSNSALDAGYLLQRGIETVMFGPGKPELAHTDREQVEVSKLVEASRTMAVQTIAALK